jgi:hypothetical protein
LKIPAYAVAVGLLCGLASEGHASTLYDNGPINDSTASWAIAGSFAVSDSFTLTSQSVLTGVTFGSVSFPGDAFTSVDWGIATAPGVYPDDGTAAVTLSDVHPGLLGYPTGTAYFSLPDLSLAAGTYYLVLQKGENANGPSGTFWNENDGPSSATVAGAGAEGSESFQILGPDAPGVPEPEAWTMMLLGFFAIGSVSRRHRQMPPSGWAQNLPG